MTPAKKAKELVDKFRQNSKWIEKDYPIDLWRDAKESAIICVDEVLKIFDGIHKLEYCAFDELGDRKFTFVGEYDTHMTGYDMIAYWKEVKKQIGVLK